MFLALDESIKDTTKIIGCVCFPMGEFGNIEKQVAEYRATQKMWSELKWNKINERHSQSYIDFLKIYMSRNDVTFHTWAYKELPLIERINVYRTNRRTDVFYKNTYTLIRSVIRKSLRENMNQFYILADETGSLGQENFRNYIEMLAKDRMTSRAKILHCSTAKSHITSPLQVADIITGAVAKGCYDKITDIGKQKVFDYLLEANDFIDLDITTKHLPSLYEVKIHHCNIDEYYKEN